MTVYELYDLADRMHVEVDAFELRRHEALSIMDDGMCYIAIDPFKLTSSADEKTKLAHELGHCATGAFYNQYSPSDLIGRYERRADKWAINQIIPKDELDAAVAEGRTEIWELAEYFNVTERFMRLAVCWYERGTLDLSQI